MTVQAQLANKKTSAFFEWLFAGKLAGMTETHVFEVVVARHGASSPRLRHLLPYNSRLAVSNSCVLSPIIT
jgi:hypothetical protein